MERVFITGRGLVTPLGDGLKANEEALRSGRSGISNIQGMIDTQLTSQVGGMPNYTPDVQDIIDRKALRFCPPVAVMAVAAAHEALTEAGISKEDIPNLRIAVVGGVAGGSYYDLWENAYAYVKNDFRLRSVTPFVVPRIMPSSAVSNISLIFGIKGESYDITAACASSALSTIVAARLIRSGEYDIVLTGGAAQIDWVSALGFCACRALSTKYNDCPEKASRPFDRNRDGFVIAGGAGFMVLESERSLKARGAKAIAEISGWGANSNASDMVVPDAVSTAEVMKMAVSHAGLKPEDINYINTHGTSTPVGDKIELEAIRNAIGEHAAINSTKSQTGHMVGATGSSEIIFTTMMMEKNFISPTVNLEDPDDDFAWADLVRECRTGVEIKHAISNSFAFGGSNAAIVISKVD
ncbi:MAG: beta-ketoacyl-[acyl-carrier-protein] synthase family protein [Lentisphaeria bacterium]|nr:beta-ketoacyl-[acyl-carrier-protein] synthase family protein [Lentisphaeria bacterium]